MNKARWRRWGVLGVCCLLLIGTLGSVLLAHRNAERRRRKYALNIALFQAVQKNAASRVEELLAQGADVNALEHYTEPDVSLQALWEQCWRRLRGLPGEASTAGGSGQSAFQVALTNAEQTDFRDSSVLKLLVEHGANVNVKFEGRTPLSEVLTSGSPDEDHLDVAELLVAKGADVNAESSDERVSGLYTPLAAVMEWGGDAAKKFLIAHGANVNCLDGARKTPLHWAAFQGKMDLAKLLIAKGANLQAQDALGQTPLMLARKGNHPDMAAFLMQQGAKDPLPSPDSRNAKGQIVLSLPLTWRNGPVPLERLRFVGDASQAAPTLTLEEGERPVTQPVVFTSLLDDTRLWTTPELNSNLSQLQRGYYARNGYQFCGPVTSHNRTYLGIRWFSPASSYQEVFAVCIFRLGVQGSTLTLTLVRKTGGGEWPEGRFANSSNKVPFLSTAADGELLLTEVAGVFMLDPSDTWRKVGPPPKRLQSVFSTSRIPEDIEPNTPGEGRF